MLLGTRPTRFGPSNKAVCSRAPACGLALIANDDWFRRLTLCPDGTSSYPRANVGEHKRPLTSTHPALNSHVIGMFKEPFIKDDDPLFTFPLPRPGRALSWERFLQDDP